jgi:phenylpropionate dioxygenase-like ring-hydroxylating dioxygenase large terminal subunit
MTEMLTAPSEQTIDGHPYRIDTQVYLSEDWYRAEIEHVFRRSWLNVARVEQVAAPGSYLKRDLPGLGVSLVISRDLNGRIHAVHNVCSHRHQQLVWDDAGHCEGMLTCPYHGWRFDVGGKVLEIPDEESFPRFDRSKVGLARVAVDVWEGFIFVNLDPEPKQSLAEFLGEMGTSLHGYPFEQSSRNVYGWTCEVKANWKLVKDAFQEVYHVPTVHGRSLPNSTGWQPDNPYSQPINIELIGDHARLGLPVNPNIPLLPTAALTLPHLPPGIEDFPPGVNPTRSPLWTQDINVIFPNFFIDATAGQFLGIYYGYSFWPTAVDRTLFEMRIHFREPATAAERWVHEYQRVLFRELLLEDCGMIERNQAGMASGAKKHVYLQRNELALVHGLEVIERMIKEAS